MKIILISILLSASIALGQSVTCTSTLCTSPLPFSAPSVAITGGTVPTGGTNNLYLWQYAPATGIITLFPYIPTAGTLTSYLVQIPQLPYTYGSTRVVTVLAPGATSGSETVVATPCSVQANTSQSPLIFLSCQVLAPGVVTVYAVNLRSKLTPTFPATLAVYGTSGASGVPVTGVGK